MDVFDSNGNSKQARPSFFRALDHVMVIGTILLLVAGIAYKGCIEERISASDPPDPVSTTP